jgi:hypothetical protein
MQGRSDHARRELLSSVVRPPRRPRGSVPAGSTPPSSATSPATALSQAAQLVTQIRSFAGSSPKARTLAFHALNYDGDPGKPTCAWEDDGAITSPASWRS